MSKKCLATALAAFVLSMAVSAQSNVMRVSMNDGSVQTFKIDQVEEVTFAVATTYEGVNTVVVGGMQTYTARIKYVVVENADGTMDLHVPEYRLEGTVMGDLTLGDYVVRDIARDEAKNAYVRQYGKDKLSMRFKAEKEGAATMDNVYDFKESSTVTVRNTDKGVAVVNSFTLGAMPFPIVATFDTEGVVE